MILTRAPLRITLGGGGTDLPSYYSQHGGFVLSAAIDKYIYICVNRPAADQRIRLKYSRSEDVSRIEEIEHDLVRPALKLLEIHTNVEIASMADVPAGTGLGSSSAYLVALLTALHELKRERIPPQALAELAVHIERDLAGHPVGKQDQYLAAFGGITCLDIEHDGRVHPEPLSVSGPTVEELRNSLLLFFTDLSRTADTILEAQRQATEGGDSTVVDSLHLTKAIGLRTREAIEQGRLDDVGHLMHEHWENKKRRSSLISDSQIDRWYAAAREAGATGGKIVGAGGGGFLLFYCPANAKQSVRNALLAEGRREMSYGFDFEGAKVMANF